MYADSLLALIIAFFEDVKFIVKCSGTNTRPFIISDEMKSQPPIK
jgi:hypothetical protein